MKTNAQVWLRAWGACMRARMPDQGPLRTDFQVKEAVGKGWVKAEPGKGRKADAHHPYVKPRNTDEFRFPTMYVSGSPAMERGERRAVDDPHPAAFVVIQIERCLAELDEEHRAYAWHRYVLMEPIWDQRLSVEVAKPLETAIMSPTKDQERATSAYLQAMEMEHRREVWRRKKAAWRGRKERSAETSSGEDC